MERSLTTLFMLMSADGKISTGSTDELDFDRDLARLPGVREGLHQYYELEQETDLWSLNTGRVMEKMGANRLSDPVKLPVSFAIVDRSHLSEAGVSYLCAKLRKLVIITTNHEHPAMRMHEDNLAVIYQDYPSLEQALYRLKNEHDCERLTVQSGGTLNAALMREGLIDKIDVVVAPVVVGGKDTPTLVDGASFTTVDELAGLRALELESCEALEDSYLRLRYAVRN